MILTTNNQELGKCIVSALFFVQIAYILAVIPVRSTFGTKAINWNAFLSHVSPR